MLILIFTEKLIEYAGLKFSSQTSPAWIEKNPKGIIVGDHQKLLLSAGFQCLWRFLEASHWKTMQSIFITIKDDIGNWHHTVYMHGNSKKIWSKVAKLTKFATVLQTGLRLRLALNTSVAFFSSELPKHNH